MKHIKVKINKLEFNWELILQNINFTLNKNDRVSIVWSNGAWKTTLLKIITWEIKDYDWFVENIWNIKLWYLKQIYTDNENKTVRDELKDWFKKIKSLEKKIKDIEKQMLTNKQDMDLIEKYTQNLEQFNNIWWNEYNNKIHQVANWMGILNLLPKKLCEVSWWQRTKIALAKVLLESPEILFLDEPTNFIDMSWVEWLEWYLKNKWKWAYVIISHDREFLDKTCNKTYEIQPKNSISYYHMNYSQYILERDKVEKRKIDNYKREQEFIQKEQKLINRFRAGSRAWWAKSREKSLNKMEKLTPPYISRKPKFLFNYLWETPDKLLNFKEVFIWRKDPLFYIHEAILNKWQRIWIVWDNWVWKSTFLKTIIWQINILDWYFIKWKNIKICYYSQLHEELNKQKTVKQNFIDHGLNYPDQHLISILNHYLLTREDLDKKVEALSWGQISKLFFAILWQKPSNLLILDEPTNHLDYDTREALEYALKKYEWSLLFISHDRYFVNKLATNIWFITNDELSISYWNYEDYRFKLEYNINMDLNIFDEEAQLNLVLEDKLWEKDLRKINNRFNNKNKKKHKK